MTPLSSKCAESMQKNLGEIAELINGSVEGDRTIIITGVAGIKDAGPGDITFVAKPKYLPLLPTTPASAVIVGPDAPSCGKNLVRTEHPYLAFTQVLKMFAIQIPIPKGIHPSSTIGRDVSLGKDIALYAGVVLDDDCKIGDRSVLYPGVCVGQGSVIGTDCTIYPRVVISRNVSIGNNVIIHIGAIVGGKSQLDREMVRGDTNSEKNVLIENDIEIGANVTIDGSWAGTTIIGSGTKIDNLVHIGAGATVGSNCIIVSHASVGAGSVIGNGVTIAGQASVLDGVKIGDGSIIAARAGVTEDVGANQVISGFPAWNHEKWLRIYASMNRLPTVVRDIRELEKRLQKMEDPKNEETEND